MNAMTPTFDPFRAFAYRNRTIPALMQDEIREAMMRPLQKKEDPAAIIPVKQPKPKPVAKPAVIPDEVTIRGITYPSPKAAGIALGVTTTAIRAARRHGKLATVGLGRGFGNRKKPVTLDGIHYASYTAAARALKMTVSGVASRAKRGAAQ